MKSSALPTFAVIPTNSRRKPPAPSAEYIVFCGVHFMAESADVLAQSGQQVILPDLNAGCSMADMAEIGQVEACWKQLVKARHHRRARPWHYAAHLYEFHGCHQGFLR